MRNKRVLIAVLVGAIVFIGLLVMLVLTRNPNESTTSINQETEHNISDIGASVRAVVGSPVIHQQEKTTVPLAIPEQLKVATDSNDLPMGSFSGLVLSRSSGQGVPDAELTFCQASATHSVSTDSHGRFLFTVPRAGKYLLVSVLADDYLPFAPGWGHTPFNLESRPGTSIEDIVIYLTPENEYVGVVLDPSGDPVVGARVKLLAGGHEALAPLRERFESGGDGKFKFSAPDNSLLVANHPDFSSAIGRVDQHVRLSRRLVLRLGVKEDGHQATEEIAGQVLDPDGVPLPDARVRLSGMSKKGTLAENEGRMILYIQTITNTDGGFVLRGLLPARYDLVAKYPGLIPAQAKSVPSGTQDLLLRLSAGGGRISGNVRSKATGEPVSSFIVFISGDKNRPLTHQSFFTAGGDYDINGLCAGQCDVVIVAKGFAISRTQEVTVRSLPAPAAIADFWLRQGATLSGVVVDADSRYPIEGACLSEFSTDCSGIVSVGASTTSDHRGQFELTGLSTPMHSVTITDGRYHKKILTDIKAKDGTKLGPLEIALEPLQDLE